VSRATFAANQLVEAVAENGWHDGPLTLAVSFDEFSLDLRAAYRGEPLPFPDQRPSPQEIIETADGARRFAGFMLRHNADRIRSEAKGSDAHILFHFDH
jgi:xanthine permease XanP